MKLRECVLAALAGTLCSVSAQAETLYVIDELIVGVSSTPEEGGERTASIRSGDGVTVLERHAAYTHVRLSSGALGWVKSSYLSAAPPLRQQLATQAAEVDRLKAQIAGLQAEASRARAAPPAERQLAADPPASLPQPQQPIWRWALLWLLLGLIAGFALGWRMLDRRIRRKYGGLRIY
jgi:hypothetical protein